MLAVEYHSNDDVRIVDLPIPEIGPGEVLVQLQACGLCASDVMEWYMKPRAPIYPGHEPAGIVVAVGEGVQQFSVGQRVFIHHHVPCMLCHFCQRGSFSQCPTFRATRLYPGGLAEYIRVPALNVQLDVLPLPDELSFEAATLIEPLACCVRGINRSAIQSGGRKHALDAGIDHVLDPGSGQENLIQQIYNVNDRLKPDIVLVTPSSISAMQQGLELVGPGGTVLFFAPPSPTSTLPITPNTLFFQEISLRTSYSAGPYETRLALDLLRTGRIRPEAVITHRFPLREAMQAFALVAKPGDALKVLITADFTGSI